MKGNFAVKLTALGAAAVVLVGVLSAFAAGLSVPVTNVGKQSFPVRANDIKPAACAALSLTNIVSGSGTLVGTTANDLIIGSAGIDTIDGSGGNDCIVAGNGDDLITGGEGDDVCLGGPGNDTSDCETAIQ